MNETTKYRVTIKVELLESHPFYFDTKEEAFQCANNFRYFWWVPKDIYIDVLVDSEYWNIAIICGDEEFHQE